MRARARWMLCWLGGLVCCLAFCPGMAIGFGVPRSWWSRKRLLAAAVPYSVAPIVVAGSSPSLVDVVKSGAFGTVGFLVTGVGVDWSVASVLNLGLAPLGFLAWLVCREVAKTVDPQLEVWFEECKRAANEARRRARALVVCDRLRQPGGAVPFAIGGAIDGCAPIVDRREYRLLLVPGVARLHVVILGAPGSGKTETAMRLIQIYAAYLGCDVVYVDVKGDDAIASRFDGLMRGLGRSVRYYPWQDISPFRGVAAGAGAMEARHQRELLISLTGKSDSGEGAFYFHKMNRFLQQLIPDGQPVASTEELLKRLAAERARTSDRDYAAAATELEGIVAGALANDGTWHLGDTNAAYIKFVGSEQAKRAQARPLLAALRSFAESRRRDLPPLLVVLDEVATLEDAYDPSMVEQLRTFNCIVVIIAHSPAGLGQTSRDVDRTFGASGTRIIHRQADSQQLVSLAGTELVEDRTIRRTRGIADGDMIGMREQPRLDANAVARLEPGECFIDHAGEISRGFITPVPPATRTMPPFDKVRKDRAGSHDSAPPHEGHGTGHNLTDQDI